MLLNLINELKKLYIEGGISNINYKNLIKKEIYNDIMTIIHLEKHNYDVIEYCSILIDRHDDYIIYISSCND